MHLTSRAFIFAAVATALLSGCFTFDLGPGPTTMTGGSCAPICNGDKTGCPQLAVDQTALAALREAKPLAATILKNSSPRWLGAFQGVKITRAGTPSPDPEVTTVLGKEVKLYTAGWVFKYCSGMDSVLFGAGPQTSTAQSECGNLNCSAVMDTAEPAIDSAAAISAAFPGDPTDTLYELTFMPAANNGARFWNVTKRPNGPTVKIDADSGAVIP